MISKCKLVLVAGFAIACSGTASATVIETVSQWNGSDNITSFGEFNSATYGQTFEVTGPDTQLDSWTFYLDDFLNPDSVDFSFYLMDWNQANVRAVGPVLYQSGMVSSSNNGGAGGQEAFTFDLGGLGLVANNDYVAFLSASEYFDGSQGTAAAGSLRDESAYTGGSFFWQNNGQDVNSWTSQGWSSARNFGDLAFSASFSAPGAAVPEPGSLALLGLGLAAMGFVRRKSPRNAV